MSAKFLFVKELMDFIDDQYNFLDDLDEIEESSSNEEEKYQQTSRRSVSLESLEDKDKSVAYVRTYSMHT